MIVTMSKIYIVAHKADRDRLLEALRDLAVVHLKPVDAARAVADAETTAALDRLGRAIQILEGAPLAGEAPDVSPSEAAEEVLRIQRDAAERTGRLNLLHRQTRQRALWGDVQLEQFETLRQAGIDLKFFAVPTRQVARIQAECVQVIAPMPGKILAINVGVGDRVQYRDVLCILEAMKMENEIMASVGGVVKEVRVAEGQDVLYGDVLVVMG